MTLGAILPEPTLNPWEISISRPRCPRAEMPDEADGPGDKNKAAKFVTELAAFSVAALAGVLVDWWNKRPVVERGRIDDLQVAAGCAFR